MYNTKYCRVNDKIVKVVITPEGEQTSFVPMVILDVSGSMSGSRLSHCIGALNCFLQQGPIKLITFNDRAVNHGQVSKLPPLSASGGTSFNAAFNVLRNSEHTGPVIFMTDGEDTSGFDNKLSAQVQIFTVGIESQSHTRVLIDIARNSPVPGDYTFFSAKANNYIQEAEILARKVRATPIVFAGKEYFLSEKIELFLEDSTTECEPSTLAAVDYLAYRTDQLVQLGERAPVEQVKQLRDEATEIFVKSGSKPLIERKSTRTALQPVYSLLNKFYELRHANMRIGNEQLANLAMSARDARTSRFAKMAVDRASENESKITQQDERLAILAAAFDVNSMELDLECTLCRSSVAELMKNGDCLGVGIQCVPSEVCIADPTRLKLTDISTSHFGCNQFLEASEWALPKGVTFGQATQVLPDSSRINVSAVLPLYLNPTHWQFAKEYLLRMVGHACCKDPLQGTLRHIVFTYLKAYSRAKQYQTEFHDKIAQELALVVRNLPKLLPTPEEFCDVQKRATDVVPSFKLLELSWEIFQLKAPAHYEAMKEEELLRRAKDPKTVVQFPKEWIQSYALCYAPQGAGDLYTGLRVRAINTKRPDVLERLPSGAQDSTLPDFVECASPVEPQLSNIALEIGSSRRRALIALQAWRCPKSTDLVNYVSYHEWTEDQINQAWEQYCSEQLQQQRSAALSVLIARANNDTVERDLAYLKNASLLEWLAILTRNCYIGRNIRRYAEAATDLEHIKMLSGSYNAGPLLGFPEENPFWVRTLNDEHSDWVPSTSKKSSGFLYRRWLGKWGKDLLHVFPSVALRSNSVFLAQLFAEKATPADYTRLFDGKVKEQCDMVMELFGLPKVACTSHPNVQNMVLILKKQLNMF